MSDISQETIASAIQRLQESDVIANVRRNERRWRTWFPSEESHVELTRADVLALVAIAEAYLSRLAADRAERKERGRPIDRDWLRSLGFERCPDEVFPGSEGNDNERLGRLVLWEFNDTSRWLFRDADWMGFSTRGQLLDLLAALGVERKGGA